ncbi:MAG: S9 family peptidase, partial [Pseudomonadota bacterium]|nr:S9 family peptidase [Pseudomonadota bacterium]
MPNRLSRLVGAAAIALCAVAVPAQAKEPLPISEYGKLPDVERSAISPSGDRIAVLTTMQGKRVILAIEDQTKALTAIAVGDTKVRGLRWISEDRLLLTSSQTEDLGYGFTTDKAEVFVAQVLPLSASVEGGTVFGNSPKYPDIIIGNYGIRQIDGKHYGFFGGIELVRRTGGRRSGYQLDHARPYLFKVDLQTFEI